MNVFKMSKSLLSKVMILLVVLVTSVLFIRVDAQTAEYPFENDLKNAPTWYGATESADKWQLLVSYFNSSDLSADKDYYVAVEVKVVTGNPGLTVGVIDGTNSRRGTFIDGNKMYTVSKSGEIKELSVLYASVNLGEGFEGMLVMPVKALAWQDGAGNLATINAFYMTTNALYNRDFSITVGEIGIYDGNFQSGGTFTKVKDLSTEQKQDSYFHIDDKDLVFPEIEPEQNGYPFNNDLKNAPTWYGATESADKWQLLVSYFNSSDLSADKDYYVAVEVKVVTGNPGLTVGVIDGTNSRRGTFIDGNKMYTVSKSGEIKELSVLYASVNLGEGFEGMLVMPVKALAWQDGAGNLATINAFYMTTNALYNRDFSITVGEIGIYDGNFQSGGTFTKVKDLSTEQKQDSYFHIDDKDLVFPTEQDQPVEIPIEGQTIAYPFRTGEFAFKDAVLWSGINKTDHNWQTLVANFTETDLTNATYIAVQYYAKAGTPGLTFGLNRWGARYSIAGHNGEKVYFANETGLIKVGAKIQNDAANISGGSVGMLLIPMSAMGWQFGPDGDRDLAHVHQFIITTDSFYNWNLEVLVGELGYYTGEVGSEDFTFHKIIDLSNGSPISSFQALSDNPDLAGRISVNKIDQKVYGDTTLEVFGTNKSGSDYEIWKGGSFGEVTMGKDSYGDDAIVMKSTGPNPTGDAYTAITLADGIAYDWSDAKGVTLWARNDSETEISFNIQLDCLVDVDGDGTRDRGRFNVRQGFQFWLYDLNTGKDTIYMTRPEITLPVGFEGWIRVPFEAFLQADWSLTDPNHKVIPRNYFMAEGSVVGYLAITIDSRAYAGQTFAVNKIGSYKTTPVLTTAIIKDDSKSIRKLMGLE